MRQMVAIRRLEASRYEIALTEGVRFVLTVEAKDGIDLVTWQDDFDKQFEGNVSPAQPLFEAVLAFHRACRVQLA